MEGAKLSLTFGHRYGVAVDLCDPASLDKLRHYFDVFLSKFRGFGRLPVHLSNTEESSV